MSVVTSPRLSIVFLAVVLLAATGCSRTNVLPYHSTASIPHYSRSTKTTMALMRAGDDARRPYGVAWAMDEGEDPYVLMMPVRSGVQALRDLQDAAIVSAAPISMERAAEFVEGLAFAGRTWRATPGEGQGMFYEFQYAPEQDIARLSENVVEWRSSVRFFYSHTSDGPAALLRFGVGETVFNHEITDADEIRHLEALVRAAINRGG